jgi:hypothetical protein
MQVFLPQIGGLHRPSSGELKIDGVSIVELSDRELT